MHRLIGHLLAGLVSGLLVTACDNAEYETGGQVSPGARPRVAEVGVAGRQILFGDLHVHTTWSMDAFEHSLGFAGGEGAHPPADACDYARFCSQLDFWSINDHASGLTPQRWKETRRSIAQCNAVGDGEPDTVAFLGWEWTHVGGTPKDHWGHKNVILPGLDESGWPPRPIQADTDPAKFRVPMDVTGVFTGSISGLLTDSGYRADHLRYLRYLATTFSPPACDPTVPSRQLPQDCRESAATPAELFERIDTWTDDYLVIPHGTSWGLYTPPGSDWGKQLRGKMHNPDRQTLIEVYSGHGNSEEYRSWRGVARDSDGKAFCPPPGNGYLPCCWQAGEIIRQTCEDPLSDRCEKDVAQARAHAVDAGASAHLTLRNVKQEDWANCGVCEDCFLPAFNLRPAVSAQAALARGGFEGEAPRHFRFGFIAASDNHSARPGTGYKEVNRAYSIDRVVQRRPPGVSRAQGDVSSIPPGDALGTFNTVFNSERAASMLYTGGLTAVHSEGRTREDIWAALKRREVYGTSGPRILLWFDYLDASNEESPMGSELRPSSEPRFRARALGGFRQKPGCPGFAGETLGSQRLQRLCRNECYHPGDERHPIERIEVIRVLPQQHAGESMDTLVQDPWKVIPCQPAGGEQGCQVEFSDPEFSALGRQAAYYVRAIQRATPTINGGGLRCDYDEEGNCLAVKLCYGHDQTARDDDCLSPVEHRAWSSPIYLLSAAESG